MSSEVFSAETLAESALSTLKHLASVATLAPGQAPRGEQCYPLYPSEKDGGNPAVKPMCMLPKPFFQMLKSCKGGSTGSSFSAHTRSIPEPDGTFSRPEGTDKYVSLCEGFFAKNPNAESRWEAFKQAVSICCPDELNSEEKGQEWLREYCKRDRCERLPCVVLVDSSDQPNRACPDSEYDDCQALHVDPSSSVHQSSVSANTAAFSIRVPMDVVRKFKGEAKFISLIGEPQNPCLHDSDSTSPLSF